MTAAAPEPADAGPVLAKHYLDSYSSWAPTGDVPGRWTCAPACGASGPIQPGETARALHLAHVVRALLDAGIDDVELARVEALTYAAEEVDGPDGPELTLDGVRDWLLGRV